MGWQLDDGTACYVLQGGVLSAASLLDWLATSLGPAFSSREIGALAGTVSDGAGVMVLPAVSGLGAPWYRPQARAVLAGLTTAATSANLAWAVLDAIAQRVCDIIEAVTDATGQRLSGLRVDGGLTGIVHLMQRQADLLGMRVLVAADQEATARGTALLAGVGAGVLEASAARPGKVATEYLPRQDDASRTVDRAAWRSFVETAAEL